MPWLCLEEMSKGSLEEGLCYDVNVQSLREKGSWLCRGGAGFVLCAAVLLFNQEARKSEEYHVNATTKTTLEYAPPGSGKNRGDGLAVGPAESLNL